MGQKGNKVKMMKKDMGESDRAIGYRLSAIGLKVMIVLLALFSIVSAQVIGGEVVVDSRYDVKPDWQNVFVYNIDDLSQYADVLVSPENFRYSFSNSKIGGGSRFSEGSVIVAEILDFENAFVAGPVFMNLSDENNQFYSCEDCDIFPVMEFREVVQLKNPSQELYVSSDGTFPFEVNVYDDCDSYFVREAGELEAGELERGDNVWEQFCWLGCDYKEDREGDFGLNEFRVVTDCHTGKRYKAASGSYDYFLNGEWIGFVKEFEIMESGFGVNFFGEKSQNLLDVVDFIPDEFDVFNISHGGVVYDEEGYYAIEWSNVSGESFDFSYNIRKKGKVDNCDIGLRDVNGYHYGWEVGGVLDITDDDFWFECNFSNDVSVYVVESVEFSRQMDEKIAVSRQPSAVSLRGEVSENVTGVEFREYVPVSFEVLEISDAGWLEISSSSYNVIVWNVTGDNFEVSYNIMPTISGDFSFMGEFGGERMDEYNISVYDFVPPIGPSKGSGGSGGGSYMYKPKNFSVVDSEHPLIDKMENLTAGLYSEEFEKRGAFEIFGIVPRGWNRSLELFDAFSFETNLGENIGKMSFEYKASRDDLKFYGTDKKGKRNLISGMAVSSTGDEFVYRYDGEFLRDISVWKEKGLNWWQKFLRWLGF